MGVLDELYAAAGVGPDSVSKNSNAGKYFAGQPVVAGPEIERILTLPEYDWQSDPRVPALVETLSKHLRRKDHVCLRTMQAVALSQLYELGRANTVASLGTGKTLVSALAPTLLGAKRPLMLNYARLIDKTEFEFRQLTPDWRVHEGYTFLSFEKLSMADYAEYLLKYEPDFLAVDEAQGLSNPNGARFKRLARFKEAHPNCPILLLTGTPGSDSIRRYAHLQELLHGDESPLPRNYELDLWCQATDVHVQGIRRALGDLERFGQDLDAARAGIRKRMANTKANVYHLVPEGFNGSIYVDTYRFEDTSVDEHLKTAREEETLPDGRAFAEVYDIGLIVKRLSLGFADVLNPLPPEDWRAARRALGAFVREAMQDERLRLDTAGQVISAIRHGELDDGGCYAYWKEIEPSFVPWHSLEWISYSAVDWCAGWAKKEGGLVWTTLPSFGRKLAERSGLPFFAANGKDPVVGSIEGYSGGPAVLSFASNHLGRNLQRWHKNLMVAPSGSADQLSQALGRTARSGQTEPVVEFKFVLSCLENLESIHKARETARAAGDPSSRVNMGDWNIEELTTARKWAGPRWRK